MMRASLIVCVCASMCVCAYAKDYKDTSPGRVSKSDLEIINSFEKLTYDTSDADHSSRPSITEIVAFIKRHKAYSIERNLLKLKAIAGGGYKSKTAYDTYNQIGDRQYETGGVPYYKAGVMLEYPILDSKERQQIAKNKMLFEQKLVDAVSKYYDTSTKLHSLHIKLKFLRLKQIRAKVRQHAGVESLDSRIDIMEKILSTQADIAELSIESNKEREMLLSFVLIGSRPKLKEMLK